MNTKITQVLAVCAIAGGFVYGCDQADIDDTFNTMFRGTPPFVPDNNEANCLDRQAEVVGVGDEPASMRGITPDTLRWAIADVPTSPRAGHQGVNTVGGDDRGQEYTEYYAVISPELLGLDEEAIALGQLQPGGRSVSENALPDEVVEALEDAEDGDMTVGACVAHSWHSDIKEGYTACAENDCLEQDIGDGSDSNFPFSEYAFPLEMNADNLRMKVSFNSNRAAADLVEQCLRGTNRDGAPIIPEYEKGGNTEAPFFRGCMGAGNLFETEWRRSDPTVCAAANRLRECGCGVPGLTDGMSLPEAAKAIGDAVVPPEGAPNAYKGFGLGTWANFKADELAEKPFRDQLSAPAGCRYINTGDNSKTAMVCRMTVDMFLENPDDPKETCREVYGNDVVVHVPLPAAAIKCKPPSSEATESCGAMPWNIGFEGEADASDEPDEPDEETSNCFSNRNEKGCDDADVESCVCGESNKGFKDAWCCENAWDGQCVSEAEACAAEAAE